MTAGHADAQTLIGVSGAARDLLPADTVDLPQMFLAQDDVKIHRTLRWLEGLH